MECQENFNRAAALLRTDVAGDQIADVKVTCDTTWKHGHQSQFGVVVVASWETGMILDVEALSKHCHACSRKGHLDPTSPEFLDWWEGHQAVCCINYTGSSNAMEKDGVVKIWERSVEKYKLRYTSMISDADSSTYPNLRDAAPYGNDHPISIHACIGHVQKRMFKHLETIKKKVHLDAEGKRVRIGGKGRLTKERMLQLQKYYGKGICANVGGSG